MDAADIQFVDKMIRGALRDRVFPAEVVSKEADGINVTVRRLGFSTPEGPYPTEAGAWAVLKVGDRCRINNGSVPIVGLPIDTSRPRPITTIGEDLPIQTITNQATFVDMLDVDGLYIPEEAGFFIEYACETELVGSPGGPNAELFLLFNGTEGDNVVLLGSGNSNGRNAGQWRMSAYSAMPLYPGRLLTLLAAASTVVNVGTITRITLQGKCSADIELSVMNLRISY